MKKYFSLLFLFLIVLLGGCQESESDETHQVDTYDEGQLSNTFSQVFQGQTENWKVLNEVEGGELSGEGKTKHAITILPIGANPRGDVEVQSLTIGEEEYSLSDPVTFEMKQGQLQAEFILAHNEPVILSGDNRIQLTVSTDSGKKVIDLSP